MSATEYVVANLILAVLLVGATVALRMLKGQQRFEHRVVFLSKQSVLAEWIKVEEANGYEILSIDTDGSQWRVLTKRPK